MKAVKGYTKHDYIMICKEEGGEAFSFASIDEAAGYFSMFGHELPVSRKKKDAEHPYKADCRLCQPA